MSDLKSLAALVVSDDENLRRILRRVMRDLGVSDLDESSDPAKALRFEITDQPYDLIIASMEMSPMTGVDFVRLLRNSINLRGKDTPVLMLTSQPRTDRIKAAIEAGIDDILAIPFSKKDIRTKIESCLKKRVHLGSNDRQERQARA